MVSLTHNVVLQSKGFRKKKETKLFLLSKSEFGRNQANFDPRFFKMPFDLSFLLSLKYPNRQTLALNGGGRGGGCRGGREWLFIRKEPTHEKLKYKVLPQPDKPISKNFGKSI
jgi:hypothetical protein